jgi:DNA-binding XRE family transcriptional regulator
MSEGNGHPTTATQEQIRRELEREREELAQAVDAARTAVGHAKEAADPRTVVAAKLPLVAAAAFALTFVLAGGIGATMRLLARRGREGGEVLRFGPYVVVDRR